MKFPVDKERDYFEADLQGQYDFIDILMGPFKYGENWVSVLRFDFARILQADATAKVDIVAKTQSSEIVEFHAEAKFFTEVQSLIGFRYFAIAMVTVFTSEPQSWAHETTTFKISKCRFTDAVDTKIAEMRFNM